MPMLYSNALDPSPKLPGHTGATHFTSQRATSHSSSLLLGGIPRRVVSASYMAVSPDGASIYYSKSDSTGIFRAEKSGLNEKLVYKSESAGSYHLYPVM
jgi:hypothetical protein